MKKSDNKSRIELYRAFLTIKNISECSDILNDLLTDNELNSINQRFTIAKMLLMGMRYSEIAGATNASTATISKVNKVILYGNDGYAKIFEHIQK